MSVLVSLLILTNGEKWQKIVDTCTEEYQGRFHHLHKYLDETFWTEI